MWWNFSLAAVCLAFVMMRPNKTIMFVAHTEREYHSEDAAALSSDFKEAKKESLFRDDNA